MAYMEAKIEGSGQQRNRMKKICLP
ncbi:uncharacterized protein G2W53_032587 [Senna tora]|uniref:Uncharacterized protein n=1 Tax=Senna tora TaxID=362788 RepID=A0A834WAC4_9FABA|nr:uncharacterized protein G2W53_032587 [Senna tora]